MEPRRRKFSGGLSLLLLAALVALAGFLIFYAFADEASLSPDPAATATPDVIVPPSDTPAAR